MQRGKYTEKVWYSLESASTSYESKGEFVVVELRYLEVHIL